MIQEIEAVLPIILIALFLWLIGLSIAFYWILSHYRRLAKGVKGANLIKILDSVVTERKKERKVISELSSQVNAFDKLTASHMQKVGLVRFNPFNETGGDQSFAITLLDRDDNGFVLTCLHTRDRTRVYAKPIKGAGSEYDLSEHEQKALKLALKSKK